MLVGNWYIRVFWVAALATALLAQPAELVAQQTSLVQNQPSSATGAVVGGVLLGGVGFVGGVLVGSRAACSEGRCEDFEALGGAILGAIVGEVVFLPIGVHIGNGLSGSLGLDLLASTLGGLGAIGLAASTNSEAMLAIGAGGQVALTVAIERMKGGQRGKEVGFILGPSQHGGLLIGARVRH